VHHAVICRPSARHARRRRRAGAARCRRQPALRADRLFRPGARRYHRGGRLRNGEVVGRGRMGKT